MPRKFDDDPLYAEWLKWYNDARNGEADFTKAVEYIEANPSTANMRKGGGAGNTLLHQMAFAGYADSDFFERLKLS